MSIRAKKERTKGAIKFSSIRTNGAVLPLDITSISSDI